MRRLSILCLLLSSVSIHAQEKKDAKPGDVVEIEIAKGMKIKFCWIPAGKAQLGSPKAEQDYVTKEWFDGKQPDFLDLETEAARGEFATKGFWLGKYAVTQEQWESVMGNNPSSFSIRGDGKDKVKGLDTSRFPVERVSWDDCQGFLKKLNEKIAIPNTISKGKFALPHENEWEYACRANKGNKQAYYFGERLNGKEANCNGKSPYGTPTEGPYLERPAPVGAYEKEAPHPWGLCDMHGNMWQWCKNKYDEKNEGRVLRGGAWLETSKNCRSAYRGVDSSDFRDYDVGFRVAILP